MTTTPHPTDALPLPELPTTGYLGDGNGYGYDETDMQDYARAAHREGYELAMSKRAAPLSRDQIDKIMTKHYPLDSLLRESVDAFEACVRDIEAALASQPAQQQAGAAEVSDEQIDEVLLFETGFDGFGTQEMNSDDLRRVCRAVLALKTAGGVA